MSKTRFTSLVCTVVLTTMLSACGKGGNSSGTTVNPSGNNPIPPPEVIKGIAMPSSVSVVTATNAS